MTVSQRSFRRSICLGLVACILLVLQGCGGSSAKSRMESSQHMKVLGMAIIYFQGDNEGRSPDSLDEVKTQAEKAAAEMGVDKDFAALLKNPLTGDDPGYEYVKPAEGDALETTVMLYQLRDGNRDETLPACYQSASVR